jgi:hypothetical protein
METQSLTMGVTRWKHEVTALKPEEGEVSGCYICDK